MNLANSYIIIIIDINSANNKCHQDRTGKTMTMERVTDDFLKFTYNKLNKINSSKMCVDPWPPSKIASTDGFKLVCYGMVGDFTIYYLSRDRFSDIIFHPFSTTDSRGQLVFWM